MRSTTFGTKPSTSVTRSSANLRQERCWQSFRSSDKTTQVSQLAEHTIGNIFRAASSSKLQNIPRGSLFLESLLLQGRVLHPCGPQFGEQRLNLNRSWYIDHSRTYNTSFYFKSYTKDLSFRIFQKPLSPTTITFRW